MTTNLLADRAREVPAAVANRGANRIRALELREGAAGANDREKESCGEDEFFHMFSVRKDTPACNPSAGGVLKREQAVGVVPIPYYLL